MRYHPTEGEIARTMQAFNLEYLQARERLICGALIRERMAREAHQRLRARMEIEHAEALAR